MNEGEGPRRSPRPNTDTEKLRAERDALLRFVPSVVRDAIGRDPLRPPLQRQMRDLSVLFMDIAGCTRLCEVLSPERMQALIEGYFSSFIDEVHDLGGTINETAGDGLMILFPHGEPAAHARAAARAALAIHAHTAGFCACQEGACADIAAHIGVNSGPASLGVLEYRGRKEVRATYTASGPVTNIAARLAALAPGGQTYIGAQTRARLGEGFACRSIGPLELKNVGQPVETYVLGAA